VQRRALVRTVVSSKEGREEVQCSTHSSMTIKHRKHTREESD
jgi:hypothetical protein